MKLRISKSGGLELPKRLRNQYQLTEEAEVTVIPVGRGLIIGKKTAVLDDLQKNIKKELLDQGVTLDDLLIEQRKTRAVYNAETYGIPNK